MLKLFKKHQEVTSSDDFIEKLNEKSEIEPVEEEKGMPYLEFLKRAGRYARTKSQQKTASELLKELFPRTAESMCCVNANGAQVAMDSAYKPAKYQADLPDYLVPFFNHTFIGWQACALLAQNPFIKKACEIPAREAVSFGYELHFKNAEGDGDPNTDKKKEQEILNELKDISENEMHMSNVVRDASIFKNIYGQILAVPSFNIDVDMSKPFTESAVKKNSYTGMVIIQPFWVTYMLGQNNLSRPEKDGYYEPEYYVVNGGRKIHKSWVVKLVNGVCPDILKPVYYYGGIPLTQQLYERVFCAEKVANEAPKLALSKRLLVIDGNVMNLTANRDSVSELLEGVSDIRDNFGFLIKNPNSRVDQIDTNLSDYDALIMTQYQLIAAIAEMPVTKLMKTQLKGLANTGEYEMKDYNNKLNEIQHCEFDAIYDFHYKLLSLSKKGKDLGVETVWNPIDTPTEIELAQIESQHAQTDATYVGAGIIDATEVRNMLRENDDSRFRNLPEDVPEDLEEDMDFESEITEEKPVDENK